MFLRRSFSRIPIEFFRIMHGGAADRSGLIHVGDEVIEVNNYNVEGKTPADVLTILVIKKCVSFNN